MNILSGALPCEIVVRSSFVGRPRGGLFPPKGGERLEKVIQTGSSLRRNLKSKHS